MTSNRKNRVLQESLLYLQYLSKLLQNLTMNKKIQPAVGWVERAIKIVNYNYLNFNYFYLDLSVELVGRRPTIRRFIFKLVGFAGVSCCERFLFIRL